MISTNPTLHLITTQAMKPFCYLRRGQNVRVVTIDDQIKELARSAEANGWLQSWGVIDHGDHGIVMTGNRRFAAQEWGLAQGLAMPEMIPLLLYPPTITPDQVTIVQLIENIERQDMTEQELFLSVVSLESLGLHRKDIAPRMGKSASTITRWFAPQNCPDEAKEYFLARKLTLGQMYTISQSPEPLETTRLFLGGASKEQAKKIAKPKTDTIRLSSIKVPLPSGAVVQLKGADLNLEEALEAASEAVKLLKHAIGKGYNVKTAQSVWADTAGH